MITYNHEKYIAKAIESVINQKANFDFEIVIGEDCSNDGTREIVRYYEKKHPQKIIAIYHEKNVGSRRNAYEFTLPKCNGEYIACLEGDDYWDDPHKLQKQVDFLDLNPDYGMVCTNYSKYFQDTGRLNRNVFTLPKYSKEVKFADYLLDMSSIGTATVMFRREIYSHYEEEIPLTIRSEFPVGDTPLWLYIAATSKIAVLPDETAVYRILENSACHFDDPNKHYAFVKKGFLIADYYIERYAKGDKKLAEKLEIKRLRNDLFHGFRTKDKSFAWEAYRKLMKHKISTRQKVSAYLFLLGSLNFITHWIVVNIRKTEYGRLK
jgi:glycosyltransferase involved in cell wall biosynthesis